MSGYKTTLNYPCTGENKKSKTIRLLGTARSLFHPIRSFFQ